MKYMFPFEKKGGSESQSHVFGAFHVTSIFVHSARIIDGDWDEQRKEPANIVIHVIVPVYPIAYFFVN
jgi:hypothetical protein